jgi:hypothetical protein
MQMMVGASSNIALGGADSFGQPDGPQHTTSQGCATHGCFDINKSSLAVHAGKQACRGCLLGTQRLCFRLESKQKLMGGRICSALDL